MQALALIARGAGGGSGAGYGFAPITALGGRIERAAVAEDASEIERSARGLLEYAEKALHALASR